MRTGAALAAAATLTALLVAPTAAPAAAPLCQGKEATILASGNRVAGTEGSDVIVGKANVIDALGGDDLICISSGGVDAGEGDDSVLVTGTDPDNETFAILGPGDDRFVGGPGGDIVDFVGDDCDAENCDDYARGADVISTGAGRDTVDSTVLDEPNKDVVDLGPGADRLTMTLPTGSLAQGQGGTGRDSLSLLGTPADHSVDLNTGTVTLDGAMATLAGFDAYELQIAGPGALLVVGTPGRDQVDIGAARVDVHLGDGDDSLLLQPTYRQATVGVLDLGGGSDHVNALYWRVVVADLARERLTVMSQPRYRGRLSLVGTEHLDASARRVVLRGTPGANTLRASDGCHVRLRGGPGADDLSVAASYGRSPCLADLAGGAGRDVLTGGWSDDRLVGGPGRDVARGAQGTDTCVAEREVSCER